jgi:hypothetical protein
MYARDRLEFNYYMKREDRNSYGVVEVRAPTSEENKPAAAFSSDVYPADASMAREPSAPVVNSLATHVYLNTAERSDDEDEEED